MPLRLTPPADYLLARDLCSYGYFHLAPNHWDPRSLTYTTTLELDGAAVTLTVTQAKSPAEVVPPARFDPAHPGPGTPGAALIIRADRGLTAAHAAAAKAALARILRLDETADHLAAFHAVDPRFARSGRGRLMRSATLFEDILKTVTSCNVTWPGTVNMNAKLCRVFGKKSPSGRHAYPTAARLARAHPATLRARCGVGYRDQRIVELAKLFASKKTYPAWIEDTGMADEALFKRLIGLPGVGPYAAANIMQLLGRYGRLPCDSETLRHGRNVLGFKGGERQILKQVSAHYAPFGAHVFRSYWFELWEHYERSKGPSWTWTRE